MDQTKLLRYALCLIWLAACITMLYQGQYYSEFLIGYLGRKPQEYPYPIIQIIIFALIYALWLYSYEWLLHANFAIRHPFISYTLCSIFPILLSAAGLFLLVYASPHLIAFILFTFATTLLHFLLLPALIPLYRKYIYPKYNAAQNSDI